MRVKKNFATRAETRSFDSPLRFWSRRHAFVPRFPPCVCRLPIGPRYVAHENNMAVRNSWWRRLRCCTRGERLAEKWSELEVRRFAPPWTRTGPGPRRGQQRARILASGRSHLAELLLPWLRSRTEQGHTSLSLAALLTAHAASLHLPHFRPRHLCAPASRIKRIVNSNCVFLSLLIVSLNKKKCLCQTSNVIYNPAIFHLIHNYYCFCHR